MPLKLSSYHFSETHGFNPNISVHTVRAEFTQKSNIWTLFTFADCFNDVQHVKNNVNISYYE